MLVLKKWVEKGSVNKEIFSSFSLCRQRRKRISFEELVNHAKFTCRPRRCAVPGKEEKLDFLGFMRYVFQSYQVGFQQILVIVESTMSAI